MAGPSIGPALPGTAQPPIDPATIKRAEITPPISWEALLAKGGSLGDMLPDFTARGGEGAYNALRQTAKPATDEAIALMRRTAFLKALKGAK